jgi:uncharacterized protein YjbI with pentapeptide repeats
MKTITCKDQQQVDAMLNDHLIWLRSKGEEGKQADFSYMYCENIDFSSYYLRWNWASTRDLSKINFDAATLKNCDLSGACLDSANLDAASFIKCKCRGTVFANANLEDACFEKNDFENADFRCVSKFKDSHFEYNNFQDAIFDETSAPIYIQGRTLK